VLVFLGLGIGMGKALQPENGRPQYKAAAQWVDDRARPGDPVAQAPGFRSRGVLADAYSIHFDKRHPLFTIDAESPRALALARRRGRLFVVTLRAADVPPSPVPGPPLRLVARRAYPGILPIEALEYATP
jgi:hypothetical protein